ncbi:hypothetical protein [Saccharicrinis carchari]|uniref:hypothetical protein n=1 Tax=Saccharicrinis carchari TaxID=1168039 RepID=UPI001FE9AD81|nr:hypothetical protein [Saccharicrinis carchari]
MSSSIIGAISIFPIEKTTNDTENDSNPGKKTVALRWIRLSKNNPGWLNKGRINQIIMLKTTKSIKV